MTGNIVYPPAIVTPGTTWLHLAKHWVMGVAGLEKDALHVYLALILLFGSVWLFRWSLRSWKPQALILAVALGGEAWDIRDGLLTSVPLVVSLPLSVHDIWNTMFWPLAIMLLARFTPAFAAPQVFVTEQGALEGDVRIRNQGERPLNLFIEIECEEHRVPPGGEAIVTLAPGPHEIDVYEDGLTLWNNAMDGVRVKIVEPGSSDGDNRSG